MHPESPKSPSMPPASSTSSSTRRSGLPRVLTDIALGDTWRKAWRLLAVVTVVAVSWLAFTPNPPPAADLGWDKANHFTAFATLAFLGMQCLKPRGSRPFWVLAAMLAFGVLIELVQSQIPGRDADAQDVLADMIGAVIGLAVHALAIWGLRKITR